MTTTSSITMIVATSGPEMRTAANTNASETDMRAGMPGTLMLNAPLRTASAAQMSQSGEGLLLIRLAIEFARMSKPATITLVTYALAPTDSFDMAARVVNHPK